MQPEPIATLLRGQCPCRTGSFPSIELGPATVIACLLAAQLSRHGAHLMASAQVQPSLVETETMWTQLLPREGPLQDVGRGDQSQRNRSFTRPASLRPVRQSRRSRWRHGRRRQEPGLLGAHTVVGTAVSWRPQTGSSGLWGDIRAAPGGPSRAPHPACSHVLGLTASHL